MNRELHAHVTTPPPHRIEIALREINQLFNTIDPSPFHEKDLDADAEEFILDWVQEFPVTEPVRLVIHLSQLPTDPQQIALAEQAVHHFFARRAKANQLEFRRLMKVGRQSLLVGLAFLALCLTISEWLLHRAPSAVVTVAREGLTIGGWVAMWRPMEIYLYSWWPLQRRGKIFAKMSRMKVEVQHRPQDVRL